MRKKKTPKSVKRNTLDFHRKVYHFIACGYTAEEIVTFFIGRSLKEIEESIAYHAENTKWYDHVYEGVCFGYKTTAYFKEEEMLKGYVAPKYKDLSESEKEIFDQL